MPNATPRTTRTNRRPNGGYLLVEQPECKHTPHPRGLREHLDWQEEKAKTHRQERCPICGLWAVWVPK